ncbi:ankyrin-2 isoform X1 [Denticeps clupeoides]|uniref:ankyrin-2 isoform X1 n=1 Tax=Denticeps clupeoides TaxID=299321 RepID=UPI0010A414EE|nr:ankyrin-2-like isoform X1 [Denticeps clupeoides]
MSDMVLHLSEDLEVYLENMPEVTACEVDQNVVQERFEEVVLHRVSGEDDQASETLQKDILRTSSETSAKTDIKTHSHPVTNIKDMSGMVSHLSEDLDEYLEKIPDIPFYNPDQNVIQEGSDNVALCRDIGRDDQVSVTLQTERSMTISDTLGKEELALSPEEIPEPLFKEVKTAKETDSHCFSGAKDMTSMVSHLSSDLEEYLEKVSVPGHHTDQNVLEETFKEVVLHRITGTVDKTDTLETDILMTRSEALEIKEMGFSPKELHEHFSQEVKKNEENYMSEDLEEYHEKMPGHDSDENVIPERLLKDPLYSDIGAYDQGSVRLQSESSKSQSENSEKEDLSFSPGELKEPLFQEVRTARNTPPHSFSGTKDMGGMVAHLSGDLEEYLEKVPVPDHHTDQNALEETFEEVVLHRITGTDEHSSDTLQNCLRNTSEILEKEELAFSPDKLHKPLFQEIKIVRNNSSNSSIEVKDMTSLVSRLSGDLEEYLEKVSDPHPAQNVVQEERASGTNDQSSGVWQIEDQSTKSEAFKENDLALSSEELHGSVAHLSEDLEKNCEKIPEYSNQNFVQDGSDHVTDVYRDSDTETTESEKLALSSEELHGSVAHLSEDLEKNCEKIPEYPNQNFVQDGSDHVTDVYRDSDTDTTESEKLALSSEELHEPLFQETDINTSSHSFTGTKDMSSMVSHLSTDLMEYTKPIPDHHPDPNVVEEIFEEAVLHRVNSRYDQSSDVLQTDILRTRSEATEGEEPNFGPEELHELLSQEVKNAVTEEKDMTCIVSHLSEDLQGYLEKMPDHDPDQNVPMELFHNAALHKTTDADQASVKLPSESSNIMLEKSEPEELLFQELKTAKKSVPHSPTEEKDVTCMVSYLSGDLEDYLEKVPVPDSHPSQNMLEETLEEVVLHRIISAGDQASETLVSDILRTQSEYSKKDVLHSADISDTMQHSQYDCSAHCESDMQDRTMTSSPETIYHDDNFSQDQTFSDESQISPDRRPSEDFTADIKAELEESPEYQFFKQTSYTLNHGIHITQDSYDTECGTNVDYVTDPHQVFSSSDGLNEKGEHLVTGDIEEEEFDLSPDSFSHGGATDSPVTSIGGVSHQTGSEETGKHEVMAETPQSSPGLISYTAKEAQSLIEMHCEESQKQDNLPCASQRPSNIEDLRPVKSGSCGDSLEASPVNEDSSSHKSPDSIEPSPTKESPCPDSLEGSPTIQRQELFCQESVCSVTDHSFQDDDFEQKVVQTQAEDSELNTDTLCLVMPSKPNIFTQGDEEDADDKSREPHRQLTPEDEMFKMAAKIKTFDEMEKDAKVKKEVRFSIAQPIFIKLESSGESCLDSYESEEDSDMTLDSVPVLSMTPTMSEWESPQDDKLPQKFSEHENNAFEDEPDEKLQTKMEGQEFSELPKCLSAPEEDICMKDECEMDEEKESLSPGSGKGSDELISEVENRYSEELIKADLLPWSAEEDDKDTSEVESRQQKIAVHMESHGPNLETTPGRTSSEEGTSNPFLFQEGKLFEMTRSGAIDMTRRSLEEDNEGLAFFPISEDPSDEDADNPEMNDVFQETKDLTKDQSNAASPLLKANETYPLGEVCTTHVSPTVHHSTSEVSSLEPISSKQKTHTGDDQDFLDSNSDLEIHDDLQMSRKSVHSEQDPESSDSSIDEDQQSVIDLASPTHDTVVHEPSSNPAKFQMSSQILTALQGESSTLTGTSKQRHTYSSSSHLISDGFEHGTKCTQERSKSCSSELKLSNCKTTKGDEQVAQSRPCPGVRTSSFSEDVFETRPIWDNSVETQIQHIPDSFAPFQCQVDWQDDADRKEETLVIIADLLGFSWTELAKELEFNEDEIQQIRSENPNSLQEQSHALLQCWVEREGKHATEDSLIKKLTTINRMDIVHLIETQMNRSVQEHTSRTYAEIERTLDHSEALSSVQEDVDSPRLVRRVETSQRHPPAVSEEDLSVASLLDVPSWSEPVGHTHSESMHGDLLEELEITQDNLWAVQDFRSVSEQLETDEQADEFPDISPPTVTEEQYLDEEGNTVVKRVTRKVVRRCVSADGVQREDVTVDGAPQGPVTVGEGDRYSKVVKRTVLRSEGDHTEVTFCEWEGASASGTDHVDGQAVSQVMNTSVLQGERLEKHLGDPSLAYDLASARKDFIQGPDE